MEDSSSLASTLGALAVLLLVVAFFTFFIVMLVRSKRKSDTQRQSLLGLGFLPIAAPADKLLIRLKRLYQHQRHVKLQVRRAFGRPLAGGGQITVFDLLDTGGDESNWLGHGLVGVISPALHLPDMLITPQLDPSMLAQTPAFLLNFTDKVLQWAASKGGYQRVEFPEHLGFDLRYLVMARDEAAARAFLTDERMDHLAGVERPYIIEASGDLFVIKPEEHMQASRPKLPADEELAGRLADAEQVLGWLQ